MTVPDPRFRFVAAFARTALFGSALAAWIVPIAFFYGRDVYGSYVETGAIDAVQRVLLLRYVLVELFVCGAVLYVLWNPGRTRRVIALSSLLLFASIQFVQYRSLASSNDVLTPSILRMAGLIEYAATPIAVAGALLLVLAATLWLLLVARALRIAEMPPPERWAGGALFLAGALLVLALPHGDREASMAKEHALQARSPVAAFVVALAGWIRENPVEAVELTVADRQLARSYGLHIDSGALTPLRRPPAPPEGLPFPRVGVVRDPNVIVLFVESLSANLLEPYGIGRPGLTPNIAEMARHSMRVDRYFNHTFPTIRGVRGQLCSTFPAYITEDWEAAGGKLNASRMRCLPHVLREAGYDTVYLSYARKRELYLGSQFLDLGFGDLHFRESIMEGLLPDESLGPSGQPSDRQMFRALVRHLDRRQSERPLFLALSTVQSHTGWDVDPDGFRFGDGSNKVLNTFHNLDHEFGEFWKWFVASRYAGNTILVLTGDHTLWPHDMARRAVGAAYTGQEVDKLALIIYDPTHALPPDFDASTSSIDLAPSLLHLLDRAATPNAFAGVSMFTGRRGLLGGPGEGEFGTDTVLYWENGESRVVGGLEERCLDAAESASTACSTRRILEYLHELERTNRIWRE